MVELGELEKHHEDFAKKHVRVVAVSNDNEEDSALTKTSFPHLDVVADSKMKLTEAVGIVHKGMGHKGEDTNVPTTILVGGDGKVIWLKQTGRFIERYSPDELLKAIE